MSNPPVTGDLLEAARETLRERVMPALDPEARHAAALVGNALAIAARSIELGAVVHARERELLAGFYGAPGDATLGELRRRLCRDLRARGGIVPDRAAELRDLLELVADYHLAVSRPGYPRSWPTPEDGG